LTARQKRWRLRLIRAGVPADGQVRDSPIPADGLVRDWRIPADGRGGAELS
jgi:hypothetical protein